MNLNITKQSLSKISLPISSFFGHPLGKAYQLLKESQYWSTDRIQQHQVQALLALVHHCYYNVPYYHDLMKKRGLLPEDFQTLDDLTRLPYLTRDIIRQQGMRLRAINYPDNKVAFRRSGGTTGEPIKIAADSQARAYETAAYLRGFEWMGYILGSPMVRLFGGSLGLPEDRNLRSNLRDWIFNSRFLPAFELNPDNVLNYVDIIRQAKGGVLVGYTSAVRNLAQFMDLKSLHVNSLRSVICTAEYMPAEWRQFISHVFQAPVYCYYGCGEVHSMGYECSSEEGYLVPTEHIVLEAADGNPGVFRDVGRGEACVTTLFNYAMPLLRYLNGDMLDLSYTDNGRGHQRIVRLDGRVVDQLQHTDGHTVSGAFVPHLIYKSGLPVWKYQMIQHDECKIDFHFSLRDGAQLTPEDEQTLTDILRDHLGNQVQINFIPEHYELTKSGKHRFVINRTVESNESINDLQ